MITDWNRCPHCGQPALSFMQKIRQGPALPAKCRACDGEVVVPYWAGLTAIPFLIVILGGFLLGSIELWLLIGAISLTFMILARWLVAPLIKPTRG